MKMVEIIENINYSKPSCVKQAKEKKDRGREEELDESFTLGCHACA